jgi:hypothetical protein
MNQNAKKSEDVFSENEHVMVLSPVIGLPLLSKEDEQHVVRVSQR